MNSGKLWFATIAAAALMAGTPARAQTTFYTGHRPARVAGQPEADETRRRYGISHNRYQILCRRSVHQPAGAAA
jgi:hypothetical protein